MKLLLRSLIQDYSLFDPEIRQKKLSDEQMYS